MDAEGEVLLPLDEVLLKQELLAQYQSGLRSVAIVFIHGWKHVAHEQAAARLAREIGFTQVSTSHQTSPLMKFVSRGDTTVVDAYLSPILRRYVDRVAAEMPGVPLYFMQSSGGLTDAHAFQGKDAILSGPAGGIVGMARTAQLAGQERVIGFDMGGTSTDVSHFAGEFERAFETQVAGVRMRAPMMSIHTVAAGGGSILSFDGARFRVGPESAGANPGPACYRRGGPLAVTDANVMVGKLQPEYFPHVFGPNADQPLDADVVQAAFAALAHEVERATGAKRGPEEIAQGCLAIANDNMANAIKEISVKRGIDVTGYTQVCFGGAGAQHACQVADLLSVRRVFIHPFASVLSAYGMGLADGRTIRQQAVEKPLGEELLPELERVGSTLREEAVAELKVQQATEERARTDWTPQITVDAAALMPESYIGDLDLRLAMYRRLAALEDPREVDELAAELVDRFGKLPVETAQLLQIVTIKQLCKRANVDKIDAGPKGIVVAFQDNRFPKPERLISWIQGTRGQAKVRPDHRLVLLRETKSPAERLKAARKLVDELASLAV